MRTGRCEGLRINSSRPPATFEAFQKALQAMKEMLSTTQTLQTGSKAVI